MRIIFSWLTLLTLLLGAQQLPSTPVGVLPTPLGPPPNPVIDPCSTGETPCDPAHPWMRGNVEKSCAHDAASLQKLRELKGDGAIILECDCQHKCERMNPDTEMTDGRVWDALCQARCNPKNCTCKSPCDT